MNIRENAVKLRKKGFSLKEISDKFGIAKSTSSLWLRDISLNTRALARLKHQKILGQYKTIQIAKAKRDKQKLLVRKSVAKSLSTLKYSKVLSKLLCSFLFWTEGGKSSDSYLFFINSDPIMVATFIKLLRQSFKLDETKFRAMLHLHSYHNETKMINYWSTLTKIPITQFSKTYHKPNTGKRKRDGYLGSVRIRYYDSKIALELRSFYNTFAETLGL